MIYSTPGPARGGAWQLPAASPIVA
jgi:hypothetical protein